METHYCWKCKTDMPFLDEVEWEQVSPLFTDSFRQIKDYRKKHNCDLATARLNFTAPAQVEFERITGFAKIPVETIYHHRRSDWGPECKGCKRLLRSLSAKHCYECGRDIKAP